MFEKLFVPNVGIDQVLALILCLYYGWLGLKAGIRMMSAPILINKKEAALGKILGFFIGAIAFYITAMLFTRMDNFIDAGRVAIDKGFTNDIVGAVLQLPGFLLGLLALAISLYIFQRFLVNVKTWSEMIGGIIVFVVLSGPFWWFVGEAFSKYSSGTTEITQTSSWKDVVNFLKEVSK